MPVADVAGRTYEELYVEHAPVARRVALSMVPHDVADDIVAEAFTRVLGAIRAGGGPGVAFRAYLLAAVRNTASDWLRASRRTTAVGSVENDLDGGVPEENMGLARLSRGPEAEAEAHAEARLVAKAFAVLPARWRAVLWQLEVEAKAPAAIAPMFGLSANGVSALAVRAREGLRQAYLQEHIGRNIPAACRSYASALGADARGRLSRRRRAVVHDHLAQCPGCHALAGELTELNSRLGAILTPAALAGASAAMGPSGQAIVHFGAKAGAGAKAAAGMKAGAAARGMRPRLGAHWQLWKLHPVTAAASTAAGLAAAGSMVVAVSVSPLSPFSSHAARPAGAVSSSGPSAYLRGPGGGSLSSAASAVGGLVPVSGATSAVCPATAAVAVPGGTCGPSGTPGGSAGPSSGTIPLSGAGASPSASPLATIAKGLATGLGSTVTNLGQVVASATQAVGEVLGAATSSLGSVISGTTKVFGAGSAVTNVGSTVGSATQGVGSAVSGTTSNLGSAVGKVTKGLGNALGGKQ